MSHNVLLHEILLALVGHTGDVIQPVYGVSKHHISSYRLSPSLSFISAAERHRIDAIVHLGSLYHQLHTFTTTHSHSQLSSSPSPPLYLTALSTAVSTVLTSYRATILHCEQAALSLPSSSPYALSSLQQSLLPFTIILPSLSSTVSLITTALHKHRQHQYYRRHLSLPADDDCFLYHGGLLLSLLHEQQQVGHPLLSELWRSVLQQSCAVLYTQLQSWCLHGQLCDPDAEFFIRSRDRHSRKREEPGRAAQEDEEKEATASTAAAEEGQQQDSYADVWDDFSLRPSLIPSFFSPVTASKILFIGRAVNIMMLSASSSAAEAASPLFLSPAFLSFQSALSAVRAAPAFSMAELDAAVARLDAHLTTQLSSLLLSSSALLPHLQTLHSFLLLTDGHFLHFFLDAAAALLSRPPSPQANRELMAPLQSALAACNLLSHPHSALLSMQLDHSSFSYASFLPAHFLSSSSVSTASRSGLLSSPDTRLLHHSLRLHSTRRGERGAVFFSPRMLVEYGWETRFSFHVGDAAATREAEEERDACGLAFVLQNDREGALADYRRGGDGDGPLHVGIVNSLTVELSLHLLPSGTRREQIAVYHFPHPPLASSASSLSAPAFRCLQSITGDWGLFDSQHHALSISYSSEEDAAVLLVSVDSQPIPVLTVPVKLTSTLQLDGGRAWVGIVASTPPAGSSSASTAPPHSASLHSWSFAERLPASSPLLAWRNLRLAYRVSGPLSLILRPATLERYTALFRFLFSLQRCHHALQQSFTLLSSLRQQRVPLSSQSARLVALRASLVFFVSAVHEHLYTDVIAPSFSLLSRAVQAETDFLQVRRQHEEHLLRVATGCWLKDRLVSGALGELFSLCDRAVDAMRQSEAGQAGSSSGGWVEAARIDFERLSCFLFTVWSRKQGVLANASLSSLLTRLDYNAHFSQLAAASGMRRMQGADTTDRRATLQ